jgi:predicted ATPase/Tfp pilus assembly protein PilF
VWFCDLTEARDLNGISSAVAQSLGIRLGKGDVVEQLGHALAGRGRCLVILDNLEQVLDPAATAVQQWLEKCPQATIMATSRERLNLNAEWVLDVAPLGIESGLELFSERAKRLRPGLELMDAELAAAREVVRLVEGIPLAIELAGARMRVMSAVQIVTAMRKRFSLLTGGRSERHETLAAAIDGSWELLLPHEKAALAQCSVFEGGFTLAAAEGVLDLSLYSDAPWPVDVVQSLLDKSLLRTWAPERGTGLGLPTPRFGMYVSLQEYARRKLEQEQGGAGAVLATEERHGKWYGSFGSEQSIAALDQHHGAEKHRALGSDFENFVAASRRAAIRGEGKIATAAYRAAWEVVSFRGPYGTAVELGREILAGALAHEERARALMILGHAEKDSDRLQEALTHFQAALVIHRELGDRRNEGIAIANLGTLHRLQGRMDEARDHYEAALAIHREVGDRGSEGTLLGNLGGLDQEQARVEEARRHYEASLAIHREVGDRRWEGAILGNIANLLGLQPAKWEEARGYYEAALTVLRELGDRRTEGITLGNLGNLESHQGRTEAGRTRFERALTIHREVGNRRSEGITLIKLGHIHLEQGRTEDARALFEAALVIHRQAGDHRWEGIVLGNLGSLHLQEGRIAEAQDALARGEALLRASKAVIDLPKLLCVRAELEHSIGNVTLAQTLLHDIEALAASCGTAPESELGRMLASLRKTLA